MNNELDENSLKIKKELAESFASYNLTVKYMLADAPISILCLPPQTEKVLIANGCLRVYDIFDRDLAKIEGLDEIRIRHLTTCVDQFLSVC